MDELKNIMKTAEGYNKDNPFVLPESYFERFPGRLSERIRNEKNGSRVTRRLTPWKQYAAAAIIILAALIAGQFIFDKAAAGKADKRLMSEISQMVEDELYSIQEEDIVKAMAMETAEDQEVSGLEPGEVIDYLMNEEINENELINAL
jgi:hypothetical protein